MADDSCEATRRRLRDAMPVAGKWAYFDHAAVAPLSQPAADAMAAWLVQARDDGDANWADWARQVEATRRAAATLIDADLDEIALVPNTTAGINFVAEGLDWRPGDNVVTLEDEFPSNLYPWLHLADRGVETRLAPTDAGRVELPALAQRCDARTRVLAVSWVAYASGCRRDLDALSRIARECGALFLVDAIQGLGVFPLSVQRTPIDVLAADGHKWLLGPEGAGVAYVRRDALAALRPTGVGWNSVVRAADFTRRELELKPTAARYEGGSHNMAGMIGLGASLKLLTDLGTESVAAAILENSDQACERLAAAGAVIESPRQGEERSGIVSFDLPGRDLAAFRTTCLERGVVLSLRGGRLRASFHAYNDVSDLERLLEVVPEIRPTA